MAVGVQGAIARHAASAKRLLAVLQHHADASAELLGTDATADFVAAIDERERMLGELNGLFQAIARERVIGQRERQMRITVLQELAASAKSALEAHERLTARAQQERDRLAAAIDLTNRPDPVARHYSAYGVQRSAGLSVTG
jgi:hypothetical protein